MEGPGRNPRLFFYLLAEKRKNFSFKRKKSYLCNQGGHGTAKRSRFSDFLAEDNKLYYQTQNCDYNENLNKITNGTNLQSNGNAST